MTDTDADYMRKMAEQSRFSVGHTKEGAEHAARLERIANGLSEAVSRESYDAQVRKADLWKATAEAKDAELWEAKELSRQRMVYAEQLAPLARLALFVLDEARVHGVGDVDGGQLQDEAERLGVLVKVKMAEFCAETCNCAEYFDSAELPVECLRLSEGVKQARAALAENNGADRSPSQRGGGKPGDSDAIDPVPTSPTHSDVHQPFTAPPKPDRCLQPDAMDSACKCCQRWFRWDAVRTCDHDWLLPNAVYGAKQCAKCGVRQRESERNEIGVDDFCACPSDAECRPTSGFRCRRVINEAHASGIVGGCPGFGTFTCPQCGSHFFSTSFIGDDERAEGYCKGRALGDREYMGCTFRWKRKQDRTVFSDTPSTRTEP